MQLFVILKIGPDISYINHKVREAACAAEGIDSWQLEAADAAVLMRLCRATFMPKGHAARAFAA